MKMSSLGEILFLRLNEMSDFNEECIHVSDLLHDLYQGRKPSESVFTRGKLYHFAIENLIMIMEHDRILDVVEMEKPHVVPYTLRNRQVRLCFTPDSIVDFDGKNILIEIKSSEKSRDYAEVQTSIYRYLLETFFKYKINECRMITGDLKEFNLQCSSENGKRELETRLGRSLMLYY